MAQINIKNLTALLAIAQKAIEVHAAKQAEREPRDTFDKACNSFKHTNGIEFVVKHSPDRDAMCDATAIEYAALQQTERATYNAKRRLNTAIQAYLRGGAA